MSERTGKQCLNIESPGSKAQQRINSVRPSPWYSRPVHLVASMPLCPTVTGPPACDLLAATQMLGPFLPSCPFLTTFLPADGLAYFHDQITPLVFQGPHSQVTSYMKSAWISLLDLTQVHSLYLSDLHVLARVIASSCFRPEGQAYLELL